MSSHIRGWPAMVTGIVVLIAMPVCAEEPQARAKAHELDILVFAPHSDDEAIGCTTVITRALAEKRKVGVVIVTAGDGFPKAAAAAAAKAEADLTPADFVSLAALRQRHSREAMQRLGVPAEDLLFLGYPDGGLDKIYEAKQTEAWRQPHTRQHETYGPLVRDYHSQVHGRPAPYVRASVEGDLQEILRARRPKEIYVTGEGDTHGDHRATFWFVRDAAQAAGHAGPLWTFVVHGKPPAREPDLRVKLTPAERDAKHSLLKGYQAGVSPVHDRLADTYATAEELFWKAPLEQGKALRKGE